MSGSPVVVGELFKTTTVKTLTGPTFYRDFQLLGIHQGPISPKSNPKILPRYDDDWITIYKPLDLHLVWKAGVIEKIIS